jgi:hypothetical protein
MLWKVIAISRYLAKICKIASVNDFKEHSRYRMTGNFKFEQVG